MRVLFCDGCQNQMIEENAVIVRSSDYMGSIVGIDYELCKKCWKEKINKFMEAKKCS